jgi:hypothetical protein
MWPVGVVVETWGVGSWRGNGWARPVSHRVVPRPHSPPAPAWSPLAALAKPRLKDLRGSAITVEKLGWRCPSLSFSEASFSSLFLSQSPVASRTGVAIFRGGSIFKMGSD